MEPPSLLRIGAIGRAHGVRGGMYVRLYDPSSDTLSEVERIYLGDSAREYTLESASPTNEAYLIKLVGVDGRDEATLLCGLVVQVRRDELPALDEGEFYLS